MSNHVVPFARAATVVPTGRMGIWWFLASEVAIFGGLIMTYVLCRLQHPEWSEQAGHTLTSAGAINTFVLLTSSLTIVLAHAKASAGELRSASRLMGITVALGAVFLCIKVYEYHHEILGGFLPQRSLFWSFYYLMTGLHALHVIAGMAAISIVALGVRRGDNVQRAEYVGMYWHLVDIVWIFLFPLLYLAS